MPLGELLEKLQVDPESPGNDLLASTQSATFLNDDMKQLISGILKNDTFQRWLFGARSAGLLIDEHASVRGLGLDSPFGTFSSMFITSLRMLTRQGHRPRFASCFFCDLHSDPSEPLSGPSGMIRSLIAQLVLSVSASEEAHGTELGRFDLSFLGGDAHLSSAVTRYDVGGLCDVYIHMVRQLSNNATVVCLINGVDDFETEENNWRAEMCWVVRRLQELAHSHEEGPAFKLCLTTSRGTLHVHESFGYEECISPGPDLFGLPVATEDAFVGELEDADMVFDTTQAEMRALDFDAAAPGSGAGCLHPFDRTRQGTSRSRGSSPGPSFAVLPLHPSRSNPEMRNVGPSPGHLPAYGR